MIILAEQALLLFPGSSCVGDGVCACLEVVIMKKGSSAEALQPLQVQRDGAQSPKGRTLRQNWA